MLELEESIKILFYGIISYPFIVLKQGNHFITIKILQYHFCCVLYVRNKRKYKNRNILFHAVVMGPFTLPKQGYMHNCLKNLTISLLAGFCMLEIGEKMK